MKKILALVLLPADPSYRRIRDTVERALRERSIEPVSLDQQVGLGSVWINTVTDAIQTADLIVADVSGNSPNVLYELGFAHALRKPVLLLWNMASGTKPSFDLAAYQTLFYDPDKLDPIRHQLARFADHQQSRLRSVA